MNSKEKQIKRMLIAKRRDIKNKLEVLKQGQIERDRAFSPITKHLQNIENKLENTKQKKKKIKEEEVYEMMEPKNEFIPTKRFKQEQSALSFPQSSTSSYNFNIDDDDDDVNENVSKRFKNRTPIGLSTPKSYAYASAASSIGAEEEKEKSFQNCSRGEEEEEEEQEGEQNQNLEQDKSKAEAFFHESFEDYLEQYDPLPRKYIREMLTNETKKEFDHQYGIRHDPVLEKFYIGDSSLKINGTDIIVKNKTYKGTKGLYELLFKKNPQDYTPEEEKLYIEIVKKTNAHKRYYKANKQIAGTKSKKYKKIIAPAVGYGMVKEVTNNKIDYVYWDDPNELCARLRLLIASQQAGHTGHLNEINSIIEELREARLIV